MDMCLNHRGPLIVVFMIHSCLIAKPNVWQLPTCACTGIHTISSASCPWTVHYASSSHNGDGNNGEWYIIYSGVSYIYATIQLLYIALPLKLFLEICVLADISEHVQILFRSLIDCRSILRHHNIPFAVGRSVCQIIPNTVKCIVLLCSALVCLCWPVPHDGDGTSQSLHYGADLGGICKYMWTILLQVVLNFIEWQ